MLKPLVHPSRIVVARSFSEHSHEPTQRYLNAVKRHLIAGVEKLWDKYAVSSQQMEAEREGTLGKLNEFLSGLGYLG